MKRENGQIITYGRKAVTIQNNKILQFYVPINILNENISDLLTEPFTPIFVSFIIDYTKMCGKTKYGPRYYAYDVELEYVF